MMNTPEKPAPPERDPARGRREDDFSDGDELTGIE